MVAGLICRCPLVRIATVKGVGSADVHSVDGIHWWCLAVCLICLSLCKLSKQLAGTNPSSSLPACSPLSLVRGVPSPSRGSSQPGDPCPIGGVPHTCPSRCPKSLAGDCLPGGGSSTLSARAIRCLVVVYPR